MPAPRPPATAEAARRIHVEIAAPEGLDIVTLSPFAMAPNLTAQDTNLSLKSFRRLVPNPEF